MSLDQYELSTEADQDLEEIFNYTYSHYGFNQASKYLTEIEDLVWRLVKNPYIGKERNELKPGLRSFPKGSHVIFYRILADRVFVVRVLHASQDIPNFLISD